MENEQDYQNVAMADLIRNRLHSQRQNSIKNTLTKESLLKISLDKNLLNLWDPHPVLLQPKPKMVEVTPETQQICVWLEKSACFAGMGYLPQDNTPKLVAILHEKVENLTIVITEYIPYWVKKMQEMSRFTKLKWGCFTPTQIVQDKVKVLQFYELNKLKILFIPPNLFSNESYHEFKCDLLLICDLHLYRNQQPILSNIINKCNPNRVLGLYHTLLTDKYRDEILPQLSVISKPATEKCNFIVLKSQSQTKFKLLMNYLSRSQYKKILVLVNSKQQALQVTRLLKMESKTCENAYQLLTNNELCSYSIEQLSSKEADAEKETRVFAALKMMQQCEVVISGYSDLLRFNKFDLVVAYAFTDVVKFVESCSGVQDKLLLFVQDDYYQQRNIITADIVSSDHLNAIALKIVQRIVIGQEKSSKRTYSECVEGDICSKYSVVKDVVQKYQEKIIKVNHFCKMFQISVKVFNRIIDSLQKESIIEIDYRTVSQIEIDNQHIAMFRAKFPQIKQFKRKINILNVSTTLKKTKDSIVKEIKKKGINLKETQEVIQIKLLCQFDGINWLKLQKAVNKEIRAQAYSLDKSFEIYKECAYGSIELARRERVIERKRQLLSFFEYQPRVTCPQLIAESHHRTNLLTSQILDWLKNTDEPCLDEHDLVLILQGVDKKRISRFKDHPIFGRYRRWRYQQLSEAVNKIFKNKKIKSE